MICYLYDPPSHLFFSSDIPELLYYSHIPATVLALLVGLFVFLNNPKRLPNQLLLIISISFAVWTISSLIAWTNINSEIMMFVWPLFAVTAGFISIFSIYFFHVFVNNRDVSYRLKLLFLLLLSPVLLLAHTDLSVSGFNLISCDAFEYEGLMFKLYYTGLSYLAFLWILILAIKKIRNTDSNEERAQTTFMAIGFSLFLLSFITSTSVVGYLTSVGYFEDSSLELYSLFSMAIFMVMIGVLIVKFKTFNVKVHAAEALTFALIILIASQYTYANSTTSTIILTSVTLVLTAMAGLYLNRSVRSEIKQRQEIEDLAKKLAKANKRLRKLDKAKSEFVSIASHQLRSPIAAMRGYTSMLLEGSYGQLPQKAKDVLERIADSAKNMALSVEDYLNVSRIESGNMKYELADFNLNDEAKLVVDDKRQEAIKNGLVLTYKSDLTRNGIVNADRGKVIQILHNLINNSIKYTEQGSITVYVHNTEDNNTINVDIIDTGVGMNEDELDSIFGKFERAAGANTVNVSGTGLGLFVAKSMAEHMGGTITAHSDGKDKGSTFRLSLPLAA